MIRYLLAALLFVSPAAGASGTDPSRADLSPASDGPRDPAAPSSASPSSASIRTDWGLDHGTWSVLHHLRPEADRPVVQLSIDLEQPPAEHLAIGRALAALRDEGVLILGSGNLTHNLRHAMMSRSRQDASTPPWASRFDSEVTRALEQKDGNYLAGALGSEAGRMSHPTPDHYLPVLYVVGASVSGDAVRFPIEGFDLSSISMRSVLIG